MSELKTLKDLTLHSISGFPMMVEEKLMVEEKQLRKEAIKWVKDRQARKENKQYLDVQLAIFDEQIGWIKHFFNLTESDLK